LKSKFSSPATARKSALVRPLTVTGEATQRVGQRSVEVLSEDDGRKPGSAGRDTPDDHPAGTYARVKPDGEREASSRRVSPYRFK
jgi:hypothetical protein